MNWLYRNKRPAIFLVGLLGLIFEAVQPLIGNTVDSGLAVIFSGLLGAPLFVRSDEQRSDEIDREDRAEETRVRRARTEPRP